MTLNDFFPGNMGRMLLIRVMIRMKRPDLAKMDKSLELDNALCSQLKQTIQEVKRG